jgi:DnaJ family protein C protein 17
MPAGKEFDPEVDYYKLLEVDYNSTHDQIRRQYRKKALKVHPDKNPSPDAAALFHALSQAYEVLTDTQAKLAYDNVIKARVERKKKTEAMDAKRRAARDELEARENAAKKRKTEEMDAEAKYMAELARMRESSGRRRREEEEELKKMMEEEEKAGMRHIKCHKNAFPDLIDSCILAVPQASEMDCTLKLKWKKKKRTFETSELEEIFQKFGPVDTVVMIKQGNALVAFKSIVGAVST